MTGREKKEENDLFFVCSVIESIGRKTKNRRRDVVRQIGAHELDHILELADVFHCEPIEVTVADLIARYTIREGDFDNIADCKYNVPTAFDIAKVYKRLIVAVAEAKEIDFINALFLVYESWICDRIDDYNASMYYENPQYIFLSYEAGCAI
jgi:hypothetical protein